MNKKRTKKYIKKLDKTLQESNRYLAGIMDLMAWAKVEQEKFNKSIHNRVEEVSWKEAKKRGLI